MQHKRKSQEIAGNKEHLTFVFLLWFSHDRPKSSKTSKKHQKSPHSYRLMPGFTYPLNCFAVFCRKKTLCSLGVVSFGSWDCVWDPVCKSPGEFVFWGCGTLSMVLLFSSWKITRTGGLSKGALWQLTFLEGGPLSRNSHPVPSPKYLWFSLGV